MMKTIAALAFVMSLFAGVASAQTCGTVPNNLTNGTTADATQVMANFNSILSCVGALRGYLGGLTMANDPTSPNTVIDTAAGVADSDDVTTLMTLSAFTKNANAAWAVGTGNGCLDTGAALAANAWYSLFVIERTDTAVVDELCSTSATSPTMPTSYTKKRRIGSFKTNSSSQIIGFTQVGDQFIWATGVPDVIGVTPTSSSRTLYALSVPTGVRVNALFSATLICTTGATGGAITGPDQQDVGTSFNIIAPVTNVLGAARFDVLTNTSGQVGFRVNVTSGTTFNINTFGWIDTRGRFN